MGLGLGREVLFAVCGGFGELSSIFSKILSAGRRTLTSHCMSALSDVRLQLPFLAFVTSYFYPFFFPIILTHYYRYMSPSLMLPVFIVSCHFLSVKMGVYKGVLCSFFLISFSISFLQEWLVSQVRLYFSILYVWGVFGEGWSLLLGTRQYIGGVIGAWFIVRFFYSLGGCICFFPQNRGAMDLVPRFPLPPLFGCEISIGACMNCGVVLISTADSFCFRFLHKRFLWFSRIDL